MKKSILFLSTLAITTLYAESQPPTPSPFTAMFAQQAQVVTSSTKPYVAKDFSNLLGMEGISDKTLKMHFKLYEGYVKNTNLLLDILNQYMNEGKEKTPQFGAINRRLSFEFDGMRLHELYFSNLGGSGTSLNPKSPLYQRIVQDFGSFEAWKQDFMNTGVIRGIGWVILYFDPVHDRLMNMWISEHQNGHMAGGNPILIMDVWEHAYLLDYGLDRMGYIKAFFNNINWNVVSKRYGT